jgi:hypothetical protein
MFQRFLSPYTTIVLLFTTFIFAQKSDYSVLTISDSLKQNANAIVRLNQIDIIIASQRSMNIKTKRVVTVLNEPGLRQSKATENYNKSTPIKNIVATIYDAFGKEIKK